MQEEQQRNRHIAGHHHERRPLAYGREKAGEDHGGDQDERELVGKKAAHGGVPKDLRKTIGAPLAIVKATGYFNCNRNIL
ncbi:hypothetical protein D9M69_566560 [compost metagenome]